MKLDWIKTGTKGKIIGLAAVSVALYAFLTLLIFGFDGGAPFWISFVFAIIGIVLAHFVSYLGVKTAKRLTDWIFSFPIMRWCAIYAVIEIIIATVFMIVPVSWKIVFIPQFLLPIVFVIVVTPCFMQKKQTATVTAETVKKVSYIREMNAKLVALLPRTEDAEVKKALEKVTDMLRHSDPMSAESLADIEQKMSECVNGIDSLIRESNYAEAASLIKEMCFMIEERNQLVIASKLIQH